MFRDTVKSVAEGERVKKGQTIGLGRTAEIIAWDNNQVLKLFRKGQTFSAVKEEAKIARAVSDAGLPVPAVCGIVEVRGRHGILYENVDGPSMLKALLSKPDRLTYLASLFAELHAKLHSSKVEKLLSQRQRLEEKIRNAEPLLGNAKQCILEALHQLPDGEMLCHGDFHPDNILMSRKGPIIIDWIDAAKGRPEADIARTLLLLNQEQPSYHLDINVEEVSSVRTRFVRIYLERYKQIRLVSSKEIESWQLPVVAARLSEGIKEEESSLLSILSCSLKQRARVHSQF